MIKCDTMYSWKTKHKHSTYHYQSAVMGMLTYC